jgi:hypothetical protein
MAGRLAGRRRREVDEPGVTSVVIAAHNEATVIGRCLSALLAAADPDLEIVVAANGCTDDTADVALTYPGVRVLELAQASKSAALNAADDVVSTYPRIYLDADIVLPPGSIAALSDALAAANTGGPLAAMPARTFDLRGRPLPIRAFYAINARLPVYRTALFGRGVIALSAAGRARFTRFPDAMADDLFLDGLFTAREKYQVDAVLATISTPRRTRDLVRRLARVRAGNTALRRASTVDSPTAAAEEPLPRPASPAETPLSRSASTEEAPSPSASPRETHTRSASAEETPLSRSASTEETPLSRSASTEETPSPSASPRETPTRSASAEETPSRSASPAEAPLSRSASTEEAPRSAPTVRAASNTSWLTDVVLRKPWLLPAGVCYAMLIVAAELTARRAATRGGVSWGHSR